ncbi:MAG: TIGR02996 domain-containing protein [Planctomycetes bacterium]|nr:TIGR02996 domain-containing protein [Planctomycetota bacterium]
MEERALYRAVLAAPHDDAPRLVYADWLDEHADRFPPVVSRGERGRAEFIRLQCELARIAPGGWRPAPGGLGAGPGSGAGPRKFAPALAQRERRLLFHHGRKWRGAFPFRSSSAPFDRGFLRPFRALRPQEFLGRIPVSGGFAFHYLPPLPADSPARRYVPEEDGPFAACPLWDVHLFASDRATDPLADRGQYSELLAEVAKSPALERVGWLKVSFFRTPVLDFLRAGNFANVETLVLNSGPFPQVLEAVAENGSFRSLRYVRFGTDRWAWAGSYPALLRYTGERH